MANSIDFVTTYKNVIDKVFALNSLTEILKGNPLAVQMGDPGSNKVKLKRVEVQGLGGYGRLNGAGGGGYQQRSTVITWDEYGLNIERSASYTIDALDLTEAQTSILEVAKTLTEEHVVPEVDATRFSIMAQLAAGKNTPAQVDITYDNVVKEIDDGIAALNERKVPKNNRILFISNECYQLLKKSGEFFNARLMTDSSGTINRDIIKFDNMQIVEVPQDYFKTKIELLTGVEDGFKAADDANDINFMIVHKPSVLPIVKVDEAKIVDNAYNMQGRGYFYAYMIYHDMIIPRNKLDSVYLNIKEDE
jgi:hypothetical protein